MRILIAAPVRQKEEIFRYYLESLDNLEIPEGAEVNRFFIFHNCPELLPLIKDKSFYAEYRTDESYKTDETSHHWTGTNVSHVAGMKNCILDFAKKNNYDYVFFVDSDLILHPRTLNTLLDAKKDIVAEIIWTRWTPDDIEAPNAWDYNMFEFRHEKRLEEWRVPDLYPIGMTGACILISKPVIQAGINYDRVYNISYWGEDRHFCIRAAAHDFGIWLDTHYPCIHLYRDSEFEKYKRGELICKG